MKLPEFATISNPKNLSVDWNDKKKAAEALQTLQNQVMSNGKSRAEFLQSSLKQAVVLVQDLEKIVAELKTVNKRGGTSLPKPEDLKLTRTLVKALMEGASECEKTFMSAMKGFRTPSNFGLPEKIEKAAVQIRSESMGTDKAVAAIPGTLVALEARASAALKAANGLLSAYDDDEQIIRKINDAFDKLSVMAGKADTCKKKLLSSINYIEKYWNGSDKKMAALCETKAADAASQAANILQFQLAVKAGTQSIKTLGETIFDEGTRKSRPKYDEANKELLKLLQLMAEVDKAVVELRGVKGLPKAILKELPAGVK